MVDRLLRMLCSFVSRTSLQLGPNRFLFSFPIGETRQPRPCHHEDSMTGPKIRCNSRETRLAAVQLRRITLPRTLVNKATERAEAARDPGPLLFLRLSSGCPPFLSAASLRLLTTCLWSPLPYR